MIEAGILTPAVCVQVCLNVGGVRYETRLKTLQKGAELGSKVLAGDEPGPLAIICTTCA